MTIAFGLLCALFYGVADFAGGRASRLASSVAVTLNSQLAGFVFLLCVLPFVGGDGSTGRALFVGALGGACGAAGLMLLYRALTLAAMSVVSPITAVFSAIIPVIAGFVLGEGLSLLQGVGVFLAIAAVGLIGRGGDPDASVSASRRRPSPAVLLSALASGTGFGLFVVALDRAGDNVGVWPLVTAKPVGVLCCVIVGLVQREKRMIPRAAVPFSLAAGFTDMAANVFATLSAQAGKVAIAGVLVSLYPASTVALARVVDKERIVRIQLIGFIVAMAALVLIAAR
jgi:drug/metabolite transporter (DMT)-like permease